MTTYVYIASKLTHGVDDGVVEDNLGVFATRESALRAVARTVKPLLEKFLLASEKDLQSAKNNLEWLKKTRHSADTILVAWTNFKQRRAYVDKLKEFLWALQREELDALLGVYFEDPWGDNAEFYITKHELQS